MERKLKAFTEEEALAYYAMQRYWGKWQTHMEKKEAHETGLREGREEGLKQGLAEGKAKGKAEGKAEGKVDGQKDILIQILKTKYPNESLSFLKECNSQQFEIITSHIFDDITLKDLKLLITNQS